MRRLFQASLALADREFRPDIKRIPLLRVAMFCCVVSNAVQAPKENLSLLATILSQGQERLPVAFCRSLSSMADEPSD